MSKVKKIKLEKEMYQEAKQKGLSFTQFLEKLENEEGIEYSGKLSELDAYQRQLMAGIIDEDQAAQELGYEKASGNKPGSSENSLKFSDFLAKKKALR